MRSFATILFLSFVASGVAIPITPAAPELQRRAEQMRLEGVPERDIARQLSDPLDEHEVPPRPMLTQLSSKWHSIFRSDPILEDRDLSGDIAPGSLEAPQMLPRAATPESLADTIKSILTGEDIKRREYGYEGKELEMRRPQGMRHWG